MDFRSYFERDPETLAGAVRIKGTRLSVDFVLSLFENSWSESEVLENYPQLSAEILAAVFAFARRSLQTEHFINLAS